MNPAVASFLVDGKRDVPHAQARMAALLQVSGGSAESHYQEVAQALLGFGKIASGVHRREDLILRNLAVERAHQPLKAFLADDGIKIVLVQPLNIAHDCELPETAALMIF